MVATQAAFAERDQQRAELDADVMAVAESIGADPSTYAGRVRCFDEMARRGHPRATLRRYVPVV